MSLVAGTRLGPYEIHSAIGAGGMGEVYKARDTHLKREVALKVVSAEVVADPNRLVRFEREAELLAALNHPHICTIYGVGTHAGQHYIAMELLEGQTLRERALARPLTVFEIVALGLEVAEALETAHAKGIVHRDIKPANLFVTRRGDAKILDFGLAKLVARTETAGEGLTVLGPTHAPKALLTDPGTAIGTLPYMSPEQALGHEVDARTDLFSLGVVLYEIATGRMPFSGVTSGALIDSLLHGEPSPVSLNPDVPEELERIINKALEKDPRFRYQSARDMRVDLERLKRDYELGRLEVPAAAATRVPSLAVLPFLNLSADKENEYFSDGLAEDIIDSLAQVPGLRLMARTSAFAFRGKEQDVREIGARLNVDHILEGSVRRAGNRIRVTAQLVKANDGSHLWSQRFDRELTDVFAIQDEISQALVEKLRLRLVAGRPLVKRHTGNLTAYDLCLRARYNLLKLTHEGREAGRQYCEQAIAADPTFAPAHVVLAEACLWSAYWGSSSPREAYSTAKAAALKALELDDTIADAHSALGTILGAGEFDWQGAEHEFGRAHELTPSNTAIRYDYAWCYAMWFLLPLGRVQQAIAEMRRALDLDPLDPFYNSLLGYLQHVTRQFEPAVAQLRHAIELDPTFFFPYWLLTGPFTAEGRIDEAVAAAEKANQLSGNNPMTLGALARVYGLAGRTAEARRLREELTARRTSTYVSAFALAYASGGTGDLDEAVEWVARGIEERDPILVTSLRSTPALGPVRSHPAYLELLRKMNLEP